MITVSISIIIVNYNTSDHVIACLETIFFLNQQPLEIIVIDNASKDDSVVRLKSSFGERIQLICNNQNLGFGRANNLASTYATGEFLLFLNPDTLLTNPDSLAGLLEIFSHGPDVGIVAPKIFEPRKNAYARPKRSYPSHGMLNTNLLFPNLPGDIAWLIGACMLMSRALYKQLNGFDPDYFLYGEDADICFRVRKAGYRILQCENVTVTHVSGASEFNEVPFDTRLRKERGFFLFCKKHYGLKKARAIARKCWVSASLKLIMYTMYRTDFTKIARAKALKLAAAEVLNEQSNPF